MTALIPAKNTDLERRELAEAAQHYIDQSLSFATRKAYASDFKIFKTWCVANAQTALPAKPESVVLFLASQAQAGVAASTLNRRLAAIKCAHEAQGHATPTAHKGVTAALKGIRRAKGIAPIKKKAATADIVKEMVRHCPPTLTGKRDRALLLLGFAGAFRRAELVALTVADLAFVVDGLRVTIRQSKTDQEGAGQVIAIPHGSLLFCPVTALTNWLAVAGVREGAVFRAVGKGSRVGGAALSDKSVANVVKRYAGAVGLNAADFAAHSLRAGFVTSAAEAGASIFKLAEVSRHRSTDVLAGYVRSANLFKDHAGADLL
ncbi:site-specific integrase [Methylomonas albis]|uniref:Tyrosine-type recombinase/integrase n=1 Tax=Methylomonas albis TaxID=1854563 RepID=A0ABR9D748_9GAMM|nr:site-specific integrase [Methylomonas albis]MBD9358952.1 tyrosine-type recombinase/integrase [Methylomonas albis]